MEAKRLIVVLGMHRSGTSAVTRGLQVMGVELGDRLMPPAEGNNPKGFWEDSDLNALNVEMLTALDSDWFHLAPIGAIHVEALRKQGYFLRAVDLLSQKVGGVAVFGFKDPRVAKMLPFWKEVFNHCNVDVSYVLAIRHPLSVVKSLAKRDGIAAEQSYLLWLGHVIAALIGSAGDKRVLVDYDCLMRSPDAELIRISKCIDLEIDRKELQVYKTEFLDQGLRHTVFEPNELLLDDACPPSVREVYDALRDVASDKVTLDDQLLQRKVSHWSDEFERIKAPLMLIDRLFTQKRIATQAVAERDAQISSLSQAVTERDAQITSLSQTVTERDAQITSLSQTVTQRDAQINSLSQAVAERDAQITSLSQTVTQRDAQITSLSQTVTERDAQTNSLSQAVAERDAQIASLSQAVTERDAQIASLSQVVTERDEQIAGLSEAVQERDGRIERINSSTSMRLTRPLRDLTKIRHAKNMVMYHPVRFLWRSLPIAIEKKKKLRSAMTRYFPSVERRLRREAAFPVPQPQSLDGRSDAFYSKEYRQRFAMSLNDISDFVPLAGEDVDATRVTVKVIAFYLPQFHPIFENDKNWGRGFTEWTNVSKATPQFVGHYQPRLPGELGFYDLRLKEIQKRQIELARQYGIYGFCYHHYWFGGKRVLEKPFEQVLNDPTLDLPFCLCWANENWTRRWDGGEDDVILAQNHSPEDDLLFFEDILRALKDSRYIRIEGKPLLIVYRPGLLPDAAATARRWRRAALEAGLPGLYLASAMAFGSEDYAKIGFDGLVQFPPHNIPASEITAHQTFLNPQFSGHVYDYKKFREKAVENLSDKQHVFPGVMMGWDNEARKPGKGHIFAGCNPERYKHWLRCCFDFVRSNNAESERLVFVNAWNEWAEGTYLEPDRRYGYAYLHATSNVVREYYRSDNITALVERNNAGFKKTSDTIVVLHLYYFDLLEEVLDRLRDVQNADFLITLPPHSPEGVINRLIRSLPGVYLLISKNKGRDILPFVKALPIIGSFGYNLLLKIHTKKSTHRGDGLELRQRAFFSLMGGPSIRTIQSYFEDCPSVGLIAPSDSILSLAHDAYLVNNRFHMENCLKRIGFANEPLNFDFVAGSMFWARVDALKLLCDLSLSEDDFEEELGQLDGTMAHAIERIFGFLAFKAGYSIRSIDKISE